MNRIFIISDTHFGHKKILEFEPENRPFNTIAEHDEEIVRRWNITVNKSDTVWHLGDVLFGRGAFEMLSRLNGIKKLVMGNHDRYPTSEYLKYFSQVYGSAEIKNGVLLTHIPIHVSQFRRYEVNIHGHLHSKTMDDDRYINVSAERIGLTPILLNDILPNVELRGAPSTEDCRSHRSQKNNKPPKPPRKGASRLSAMLGVL